MQAAAVAELLAEITLFQPLWPEERLRLAGHMRLRRYAKDEVVFHREDPASHLFVVASGTVKISIPDENGREVVFALYRGGDIFGELALFDGAPRSATVTALTETECLALSGQDLFDVLQKNPVAMRKLLGLLAQMIRRLSGRVGDLVFLDLEGRVAKLLLDLAEVSGNKTVKLSQEDLAAFAGGTRAAVNRALADLERTGAIVIGRKNIEIKDDARLREQIRY